LSRRERLRNEPRSHHCICAWQTEPRPRSQKKKKKKEEESQERKKKETTAGASPPVTV